MPPNTTIFINFDLKLKITKCLKSKNQVFAKAGQIDVRNSQNETKNTLKQVLLWKYVLTYEYPMYEVRVKQ